MIEEIEHTVQHERINGKTRVTVHDIRDYEDGDIIGNYLSQFNTKANILMQMSKGLRDMNEAFEQIKKHEKNIELLSTDYNKIMSKLPKDGVIVTLIDPNKRLKAKELKDEEAKVRTRLKNFTDNFKHEYDKVVEAVKCLNQEK